MLTLDDGSTMRWTRRPDGTWRKPERVKAGFIGELEQKKYTLPGAEKKQVPGGGPYIPGLAPGAAPLASDPKPKAAAKNEKKKEKRQEQALQKEEVRLAGHVEQTTLQGAQGLSKEEDPVKARKALEKKIRQIAELEERQAQGQELNDDQLAKLASKLSLSEELTSLDAAAAGGQASHVPSGASPASGGGYHSKPLPVAPAPQAAAEALAAAAEETQGAPQKQAKAIEKKLRQISELEQKQAGGTQLNSDQLAKVSQKAALEAELAGLM